MLGAIAGDIIGSRFEHANIKTTEFELFTPASCFTDDTVLTVALADSIYNDTDYKDTLKEYFRRYPDAGYGGGFIQWAASGSSEPYNRWGNGAAMRVSPVGFACDTLDEVLKRAEMSAAVTHNHPEGIKGAQATAVAITAGVSAEANTGGGAAAGISGGRNDATTRSAGYRKGMAIFTVAKGGLMYEASLGGQKYSFDPI